ncbi:ribonuclease Y [Candidatus Azambacteria bacterium RIFCSPHIGHO2_02_FULL_52_12]|uniref:Ribonuclease Y n=1 Tax=Candidatus Azambacteria bacterium RIFCSPLOWO2_01_FULL_46_25 TaxID=1797298 RepID=A0A1F5BV40_9BACT|nr:MAG: ribonuclease Y [Candidatus Azambacteria bacterium RIFCSPHIGHO2_02_FULL_52_12]OGD34486.1 MAG: ribonuclease Y [Candidatus Azambacteria bacterium RIFCSPLOWO2_01_FULL_46_25]OGD38029.1 MAG: ribonuclease Y [Candidatus Azambacteria bacterium RIFCSPHIGHO2_01_FULL_51_74]
MDILSSAAWSLIFLLGIIGMLAGIPLGYLVRKKIAKIQIGTLENKLDKMTEESHAKAKGVLLSAKEEAVRILEEARKEEKEREQQLAKHEERVAHREDMLDKKGAEYERAEKDLLSKAEKVKQIKEEIDQMREKEALALEKISGYSKEKAKEELFNTTEQLYKEDILVRIRKIEKEGKEEFEKKANAILATVIQRYAGSHVSEFSTTTVTIPSDEMKGKIIGREGRNIRTLERLTGAEIIVDDTPGAIVISCFDPIRRQVCKMALDILLSDGRIQPARIEEAVEKAKADITNKVKQEGEAAVEEVGLVGIDPRLVNLLGRLHYRTSFGQNVLRHSIEAAHVSAMLAEELGGDVQIARMGALFHDIGKAVDHEVQGTHVEIGRKILEKFGVDHRVVQAMQSHHEEYPYETLESIIVQIAEAISASRPGARRGTIETYLRRLEELEAIAMSFEGVEKVYAISAGREVRVFVTPEKIDDLGARKLARAVADRIQQELKYPGEIKVNVIRETRVLEFAR